MNDIDDHIGGHNIGHWASDRRGMYYDPDGNEIGMMEWAQLFELRTLDPDNAWWRIAETEIARGTRRISTVWLGLNHNWFGGPPLIFETMVFGGGYDGEIDRYTTRAEAEAGHAAMVQLARWDATIPLPLKGNKRTRFGRRSPRRRYGDRFNPPRVVYEIGQS